MQSATPALILFSVLFPAKLWYAPNQPLLINVKADTPIVLVLTDFLGKELDPAGEAEVQGEKTVDLNPLFPQLTVPGTYLLYAVPQGKPHTDFIGTPLVIGIRQDNRRDAPPEPMVIYVAPLCYAIVSTEKGEMKAAFYYDVAPSTVANFLDLAQAEFYDGLTFHRVVPDFVIQGGDPVGSEPNRAGTGGPGYEIDAEFNDRPHVEGVLSMAREGDPLERQGAMPRATFANSAGSQFFLCLNYNRTRQLDRRYTAFGRVFEGIEVLRQLGKVETDRLTERPLQPLVIKQIRVIPVDAACNPYPKLLTGSAAAPGAGELLNRPQ